MKKWICTVAFLASLTNINYEEKMEIDNETYEALPENERANFEAKVEQTEESNLAETTNQPKENAGHEMVD